MNRDFLLEVINKEILIGAEVADILGVTRQQVANLVKQQKIVPIKNTPNGNIFLKMDIEEYLRKRNGIKNTVCKQKIIGQGITRKCIEYIEHSIKNPEDVIAIYIYFNSSDALNDNYYTTYLEEEGDKLIPIQTPTFIIKFSDFCEIWFDGLNCGYGGTGPNGTFRVLTEIFKVSNEIAKLVYDSSWIKLYKEVDKWDVIYEPVNKKSDTETEDLKRSSARAGNCYLFNGKLVLVPDRMDKYWIHGKAIDFLIQHITFVPNPRSITIYSRDMAIRTGHYIYSNVSDAVYQVVISDLSGRELWLDCYVDDKVSINKQSDIMSVLETLGFDIAQNKSNKKIVNFLDAFLSEKIYIQNYITINKEKIDN